MIEFLNDMNLRAAELSYIWPYIAVGAFIVIMIVLFTTTVESEEYRLIEENKQRLINERLMR